MGLLSLLYLGIWRDWTFGNLQIRYGIHCQRHEVERKYDLQVNFKICLLRVGQTLKSKQQTADFHAFSAKLSWGKARENGKQNGFLEILMDNIFYLLWPTFLMEKWCFLKKVSFLRRKSSFIGKSGMRIQLCLKTTSLKKSWEFSSVPCPKISLGLYMNFTNWILTCLAMEDLNSGTRWDIEKSFKKSRTNMCLKVQI